MIASLQAAQRTGRGAVATVRVKTVENAWYGLQGGKEILLTIVYLSRASEWERQLPPEVRAEVVPTQRGAQDDMSLLRELGPYRYENGDRFSLYRSIFCEKRPLPRQFWGQCEVSLQLDCSCSNFPHFSTANPSLNKRCVNLLGQLSAWVLAENADQLRNALGGKNATKPNG